MAVDLAHYLALYGLYYTSLITLAIVYPLLIGSVLEAVWLGVVLLLGHFLILPFLKEVFSIKEEQG